MSEQIPVRSETSKLIVSSVTVTALDNTRRLFYINYTTSLLAHSIAGVLVGPILGTVVFMVVLVALAVVKCIRKKRSTFTSRRSIDISKKEEKEQVHYSKLKLQQDSV